MRTLYAEGEGRKRRKIVFASCVQDEEEECVRGGRLGAQVLR